MQRFTTLALFLILAAGCSDSDPTTPKGSTPADETPPAVVADLTVQSISGAAAFVSWTAPGDDGASGTATTYDVRYASTPITEATWESAWPAQVVPVPAAAGTAQTAQINSPPQPDVYIALKAADEVPNWSALSNVAHGVVDPGGIQVRQLVTDGSDDHPCVNDGVVSWVSRQGGVDEIYVANVRGASPTPTKLTDNGGDKGHPSNHGSERIVWQGREDGLADWEIFVYDKYSIPRYAAFTDDEIDDTLPFLPAPGTSPGCMARFCTRRCTTGTRRAISRVSSPTGAVRLRAGTPSRSPRTITRWCGGRSTGSAPKATKPSRGTAA